MKKIGVVIIAVVGILAMVGCSNSSSNNSSDSSSNTLTQCQHEYIEKVTNPTCVSRGYTNFTCSKCGDKYEGNYTEPLGHNYIEREQNFKCSVCNRYEDDGFTFELITSEMARYNEAYKNRVDTYEIKSVSNKAVENGVLTIPRKHLGYPVTGLYKGSLYNVRTAVTSLKIDSNIKYIGSLLFTYDGQYSSPTQTLTLKKITFDDSCKDICISHSAFQFCKSVDDINFPLGCFISFNHDDMIGNHFLFEDTAYFKNKATCENGVYYIKDLALSFDKNSLGSNIVIKDGTRLIANYAFAENTNIKSLTLPSSLVYIGKKAFYKNMSLTSVVYKGSETAFNKIVIDDNAFEYCGNIVYTYGN